MKFSFKPLMWGGLALMFSAASMANEPDAAKLAKGEAIFLTDSVPACSVCHTLKKARATGTIGPNLDEIKPTYDRVMAALREGVGVMPSFQGKLNDAAMDAVATYVVHATQQ